MDSKFRIGQVVKYSKPQPGEEDSRFYVNAIHEPDGSLKEKLHVQLICNDFIKPTFCHFSEEYESSYFTEMIEYNGKMVQYENFGRIL